MLLPSLCLCLDLLDVMLELLVPLLLLTVGCSLLLVLQLHALANVVDSIFYRGDSLVKLIEHMRHLSGYALESRVVSFASDLRHYGSK